MSTGTDRSIRTGKRNGKWSAGAITFLRSSRDRLFRYLLLRRKGGGESWDFPMGKKSGRDRSPEETAKREVCEETGLEVEILRGFRYVSRYSRFMHAAYDGNVFLFLAGTRRKHVKLGIKSEHDLFSWFPLQKAIDRLPFPNSRKALLQAHEFLILKALP